MPVKKTIVKAAAKKVVVKKPVVVKKAVTPKAVSGLSVEVFDITGKASGHMELPKEIFGADVNKNLIAQAVRVYLANQRRGTASTKSRGQVNASSKKIWKQKGTGRARHGAVSAPIFVGGGVALGPKPRDYSLKLPKKMKKLALISVLSSKLKNGEIKVVTGLEKVEPKTKNVAALVKKMGVEGKRMLLITPDISKKGFENVYRASGNIENMNISTASMMNAYEALNNKVIILMKQAVDNLKENLSKKE